ncbi:hypothetical protein [Sorangium cellulosum]|uniref:hypothetical protein n=1 Tax=Sorangium cellulosum TaxID=56 RepID=UPI0018F868DE|nr:hypothetical protein [Sorangium cellulosum]
MAFVAGAFVAVVFAAGAFGFVAVAFVAVAVAVVFVFVAGAFVVVAFVAFVAFFAAATLDLLREGTQRAGRCPAACAYSFSFIPSWLATKPSRS